MCFWEKAVVKFQTPPDTKQKNHGNISLNLTAISGMTSMVFFVGWLTTVTIVKKKYRNQLYLLGNRGKEFQMWKKNCCLSSAQEGELGVINHDTIPQKTHSTQRIFSVTVSYLLLLFCGSSQKYGLDFVSISVFEMQQTTGFSFYNNYDRWCYFPSRFLKKILLNMECHQNCVSHYLLHEFLIMWNGKLFPYRYLLTIPKRKRLGFAYLFLWVHWNKACHATWWAKNVTLHSHYI